MLYGILSLEYVRQGYSTHGIQKSVYEMRFKNTLGDF